jgi:class 3 adenylate cyclase
MTDAAPLPLAALEHRLRPLLPADLYAAAWLEPSPAALKRVFDHLRTLQRILYDYVPRQVSEHLPTPGETRHEWQEGTLMFTDLAGFTPLMEANAARGQAGAEALLGVLNSYFAEMIEIIGKSGGNLLEFTGDAMLAQFETDQRGSDAAQAVRAGLRMQRAMRRFASLETGQGTLSLGMRIGLHTGRFLTADIGTPRRMNHVLFGSTVQRTKQAEGAGRVGRVCLTEAAGRRVQDQFRFEPGQPGYALVVDDLSDEALGGFDIAPTTRRQPSMVLMDRSVGGMLAAIEQAVNVVEPMASYLPLPVLELVVETAARRRIPPEFPRPTAMFVNLIGVSEAVDEAQPGEEQSLVAAFSRAFALINAAVEARGGVMKNITYHLNGSDMLIFFGAPNAHTDDPLRAAHTALAIRDILGQITLPAVGGKPRQLACQIGLNRGPAFAAEIGEPRGRREYNVLGDTINTAARVMSRAAGNRVLMTEAVYQEIAPLFECETLGAVSLKGKAAPTPLFALVRAPDAE